MKKYTATLCAAIAATLASCASPVYAGERWTDPDKQIHFGLTAAGSAVCTIATGQADPCLWAGVAVAAAKEVYDAQHRDKHTPSVRDFLAGAAGAYVGAKFGGWIITPRSITYNRSF